MPDNLVASWTVDRGRSYELDKTSTGTASIQINDTAGLLDPTNASGPYYGQLNPLKQAAIALQNPVTDVWKTVFRGFVEDYNYDLDPSQVVMRLDLQLVDAFAILAAARVSPGEFGEVVYPAQQVDDRIHGRLDDINWPTDLREVFSGNVMLQETIYSPSTDILAVIQDAADAEFPGVANTYASKTGLVTFHGRFARFHPEVAEYGISHWKCGDGAAILADPGELAQLRAFSFDRSRNKIINYASATHQGIADADIAGQLVTDAASIEEFGVCAWPGAENLLTAGGVVTNVDDPLAETLLFSTYYVENGKAPRSRIKQATFRSVPPDHATAAKTWALICGVEIGDLLDITVSHPGGGGFDETFNVEGIHYDVQPANPDYHDVTLNLDLSPQDDINPFE